MGHNTLYSIYLSDTCYTKGLRAQHMSQDKSLHRAERRISEYLLRG